MKKLFILLFFWLQVLQAQETQEGTQELISQMLEEMSLSNKIAQLLFIDIRKYQDSGLTGRSRELEQFVQEYPVGGIILFRSNLKNAGQLESLLSDIQTGFSLIPPFLAIDEEGGGNQSPEEFARPRILWPARSF